jgi:hypothetical protein
MEGVKDPVNITTSKTVMKNNCVEEVRRTFLIQVLLDNNPWCDLFKITPSTHLPCKGMKLKSRLRLFAARAFKAAELVGYYIESVCKLEGTWHR